MNPIAKWCKFEGYRDWCYLYRIPEKEEFVEGFEYEFIDLIATTYNKITSNYFENIVKVNWGKYKVGKTSPNSSILEHINIYRESGYLRVIKDSTLVYIKRNEKNNPVVKKGVFRIPYWMYLMDCKKYDIEYIGITNNYKEFKNMELFYFEVRQHELNKETNKYNGKLINNPQYKYLVAKGETPKEAYDLLKNSLLIKDNGGFNETQGRLKIVDDSGYEITSGGHKLTKEIYDDELAKDLDKVFIDSSAVLDFSIMWPSKNIKDILINRGILPKDELQKESIKVSNKIVNFKGIIHPISKYMLRSKFYLNKTSIRPKLNILSNILEKVEVLYQTIVTTVHKYPSRLDPKTNVWKPVVKPEIKQLSKSKDRLVCIATKDRKESKRRPWEDADYIVKHGSINLTTNEKIEWEFISKEEYRKLQKPKPGLSFIPNNIDKKYKRIPIQVEHVEQEMIRNSYRDEKTGKMVYLPITYKDTDKTITKWEHQLVYDDSADNKYHDYKKIPSNPSSSKKAKCLRKSKHHIQGVSGKKLFHTYEVSFFRNMKEGSAEFIYAQVACNTEQAIARASKKVKAEGADLAYYSPKVELSIKSEPITKVKGESSYKRIIMPLVTDMPERKDKKGNLIPWTIKELKFNSETQKTELVNTEVKTFTGYQITYQKIESPFKKVPKKWKHPIRTKRIGKTIVKNICGNKSITTKGNVKLIIKKKQ